MSAYPYPPPPAPLYAPTGEHELVRELCMPIYQSRGWLKLVGVMTLIAGIFQALSLVGLVFAWIPIWQGILLMQAASSVETAETTGQRYALFASLSSLKTYFVIQGVLILIGLIMAVLSICVFVILPLLGVIPYLLDYQSYY